MLHTWDISITLWFNLLTILVSSRYSTSHLFPRSKFSSIHSAHWWDTDSVSQGPKHHQGGGKGAKGPAGNPGTKYKPDTCHWERGDGRCREGPSSNLGGEVPLSEFWRMRGMSLAEPVGREYIICWKHFSFLRKFSHVFIPKHPYLLRENKIKCKLLEAASPSLASKLFKGKSHSRYQKPNEEN